jgi:hypothetical protein
MDLDDAEEYGISHPNQQAAVRASLPILSARRVQNKPDCGTE